MLFNLFVGKFARIDHLLDGLHLGVVASVNHDLLALLAVLKVQEHILDTHVLLGDGAEDSALFTTWTYRFSSSGSPTGY